MLHECYMTGGWPATAVRGKKGPGVATGPPTASSLPGRSAGDLVAQQQIARTAAVAADPRPGPDSRRAMLALAPPRRLCRTGQKADRRQKGDHAEPKQDRPGLPKHDPPDQRRDGPTSRMAARSVMA